MSAQRHVPFFSCRAPRYQDFSCWNFTDLGFFILEFHRVMDRTHPETEHTPKRDFHFSISRNDYVNRTAPEAPLQFRYNSALDKW